MYKRGDVLVSDKGNVEVIDYIDLHESWNDKDEYHIYLCKQDNNLCIVRVYPQYDEPDIIVLHKYVFEVAPK